MSCTNTKLLNAYQTNLKYVALAIHDSVEFLDSESAIIQINSMKKIPSVFYRYEIIIDDKIWVEIGEKKDGGRKISVPILKTTSPKTVLIGFYNE